MLDWLKEDDIVHFIIETVRSLPCRPLTGTRSRPGLEPRILVALGLYAYCQGERSSWRIEMLCVRNVAYRVVSAQLFPDHTQVARSRKNHETAMGERFPRF
jgi:transposase